MNNLELLSGIKNILGEGPYYKDGIISWIDILGKKLYIFDGKIKEVSFEEKISAAIPLKNSGYLVCGENYLFLYKNDEIIKYMKIDYLMKKGMRCNDAKVDTMGRLWFSTIHDDNSSIYEGALYCLDNGIIKHINDTKLGNGMAWNKNNDKFYFSDTEDKKIYIYDYDKLTGEVSNKKVLCNIDGYPDGMTIDDNDNLFIAIWEGKRIEVRSGIDGKLIDIINMPTKLITSATFAGANLDELIITTASLNEKDEYAGKVFRLKTKYRGRKEYFYD